MSHMKNRDSNKPRREQRQAEALVRKDLASQKTPAERLEKFNATLGVGIGAARERAKLAAAQGKTPSTTPAEAPSASQEPSKAPKKAKGGKKAAKAS